MMLGYEVIRGHIDILVFAVRRLSRRWKVTTLLAPTPLFPIYVMKCSQTLLGPCRNDAG